MAGELTRLGHRIAASAVWQILHEVGIDLAPGRSGPTWRQFLTAEAQGVLAGDFVHVDTVLLRRIYVLIAVEHGSRRGAPGRGDRAPHRSVDHPSSRNLLMDLADRATTITFLLRVRDSRFSRAFDGSSLRTTSAS